MAIVRRVLNLKMGPGKNQVPEGTLERHLDAQDLPKLLAEGWYMVETSPPDDEELVKRRPRTAAPFDEHARMADAHGSYLALWACCDAHKLSFERLGVLHSRTADEEDPTAQRRGKEHGPA